MTKRLPRPAVLQRFGRLRVVIPEGRRINGSGNRATGLAALCVCDCGTMVAATFAKLYSGHTTSCGCFHRQQVGQRAKTHGKSQLPEYRVWQSMKSRCLRETDCEWHNYGGRGIKVCDRWLNDFEAFYEDMGPRPSVGLTLERYDVDGDYCPENCGWETQAVQARNRRTNVVVSYQGETMVLSAAYEASGLRFNSTYYRRLKRGLTGDALFAPSRRHA